MNWNDRQYQHEKPITESGLVSIVLPTYNRPEFLEQRILEISNSLYTNWELIIVNDGGSPIRPDIVSDKIRLIELKENSQSVAIPRNIGISYAKGEFICPADDDVVFYTNKLGVLVSNIGNYPLCYGTRIDLHLATNNKRQMGFIPDWNPLNAAGVDNGQILYRKSVYDAIPYVISTHACDFYLAKAIFSKCGAFKSVNENVCEYIWHDSNRTLSASRKTSPLNIGAFQKYFNVINDIVLIREN